MKGLLKKDWELLAGNYKTFAAVGAMSLLYLIIGGNSLNFFVAYMTLISVILVLNTMAYDDYDHGMAFLMTLPIQRETYVKEKYVFGLICGLTGWALSGALSMGRLLTMGQEQRMQEMGGIFLTYLPIVFLMLIFLLPIQLKFGSEKGKIVMMSSILITVILGVGVSKAAEILKLDVGILAEYVLSVGVPLLITAGLVLSAAGFFVSYMVSVKIMEKKEF